MTFKHICIIVLLVGCGQGPNLEPGSDTEQCTTGEDVESTGCCEIEYFEPNLAQCLCDGELSDPENCTECALLPCVELEPEPER